MNKSIEFKYFYYISRGKVTQLLSKLEYQNKFKTWLKSWKRGPMSIDVDKWIKIKVETPNISDDLYKQTLFIISELQRQKQLKKIEAKINTEDFFIDKSLWIEREYDTPPLSGDDKGNRIYALIKAYEDIVIVLIGSPTNIINEQSSISNAHPTNIPKFLERLEQSKGSETSDLETDVIQNRESIITLANFFLNDYENAITYRQHMKTVLFDVRYDFDMANLRGIPESFREYKKIYIGSALFTAD